MHIRSTFVALGSFLAVAAPCANAVETTLNWTGTVSVVHAATFGTQGPADIKVGTPVSFSVTYDPAQIVSFALSSYHDIKTQQPMKVFPKGVLLGPDPNANYAVTIASHTWTLKDDISDGYTTPVGVGPYPMVGYDGNPSQVIGLLNDAAVGNLEFYSEPGDLLIEGKAHVAYGDLLTPDGDSDGDYYFAVDASLDSTIASIRQQEIALAAIPEPTSWALLLIGGAGLAALRRRGAEN